MLPSSNYEPVPVYLVEFAVTEAGMKELILLMGSKETTTEQLETVTEEDSPKKNYELLTPG